MTGLSQQAIVAAAEQFAEETLFPNAVATDLGGQLPVTQLEQWADMGLYGLLGPPELGGAGATLETLLSVIESMAFGCLTTAFVWVQHQGSCRAAVEATGPVHADWAAKLSSGTARGGVAFAHLLRAGPPAITAEPSGDGWTITGVAPWVTGWGFIDVVHVAARHGDNIVWSLLDATAAPTLKAETLALSAINSSATFQLQFKDHPVPADRVTLVQPYEEWRANYPSGLRLNGSLSLGVARRAAALLGPSHLDAQLAEARHQLDSASVDELPEARGRASALAVRLASSLVASVGGRSVVSDQHGQRLVREANFLLIQGQTPEIRAAQLRHL